MAKLIYSAIASLDGYVEDEDGNFDWAAPDEEVHAFVNDLERPVGTYLYGRRMYETMAVWETVRTRRRRAAGRARLRRDLAGGRQGRLLPDARRRRRRARTRIEREFDPDAVREHEGGAARDIAIGGAELAAQAIRAGLVDELQLLLAPVVVGGGTHALPAGTRVDLDLREERRFRNGTVFLRYGIRGLA